MKNIYNIHFIGFGNVRNSRCHDAENTLQAIAKSVDEILCVMPYTLPLPDAKIANAAGQPLGQGPKCINGFIVVTRRTEQDDANSPDPVTG